VAQVLNQHLKSATFDAAHANVHLAIACRYVVIGSQDADHSSTKAADYIGNFLNLSRSVFQLKAKLNSPAAYPGQ